MKNIKEYRKVALTYLLNKVNVMAEEMDILLDEALRRISNLPVRPIEGAPYTNVVGKHPVVEQRQITIQLLNQRLKLDAIHSADLSIDKAIRVGNGLPKRPKGANPYDRLFTLPNKEEPKKEVSFPPVSNTNTTKGIKLPASSFKTSEAGIKLIHSFESCVLTGYKDPGSNDGNPITIG